MAVITGSPFYIKDAVLTFGSDEYTFATKSCELVPTTPKARHVGIGGASVPMVGNSDWKLQVEFFQDYETAASLANLAFDQHGTRIPFTFKPQKGTTAKALGFKGECLIEATNIGGQGQTEAKSSVGFEVFDKPARITA